MRIRLHGRKGYWGTSSKTPSMIRILFKFFTEKPEIDQITKIFSDNCNIFY